MTAIKGTALESVVSDVNRLVDDGTIRLEELEARLPAKDLDILESKIQGASWYPIDSYGRLSDLLMEVDGDGRSDYLVERGRRAAERLRASGLYSQLSADRDRWGDKVGKIMTSIGPAMFKDSEWQFRIDDEEGQVYTIQVRVVPTFPEAGRFAAQGFIEYLSRQNRTNPMATSRRVSQTEIEFSVRLRG